MQLFDLELGASSSGLHVCAGRLRLRPDRAEERKHGVVAGLGGNPDTLVAA